MSKRFKIVFGSFAAVVIGIGATAFAISAQYERHLDGKVERPVCGTEPDRADDRHGGSPREPPGSGAAVAAIFRGGR